VLLTECAFCRYDSFKSSACGIDQTAASSTVRDEKESVCEFGRNVMDGVLGMLFIPMHWGHTRRSGVLFFLLLCYEKVGNGQTDRHTDKDGESKFF